MTLIMDQSEQGTYEWHVARAGVLTASAFGKLITPLGKPTKGKTRNDYLLEVANGRITNEPSEEEFSTYWMERGKKLEQSARDYYSFITDKKVTEAGLIYSDESRRVGASVDGLVNDDGNLEIKSPKLSTHLQYILDGELPRDYIPQVQGQLLVTSRDYADFISFHPTAFKRGFIKRVERDDEYIKKLSAEIDRALEEIEGITEQLRKAA